MEQKILELLKCIEKDKKIKILFAVEAGSRAWELDSSESDYDVHFVFYRRLEDYISINKFDDQINLGFDKNLKPKSKKDVFIEMTGYDIFKYFHLLISCNVSAIDLVNSNMLYLGDNSELKTFVANNINKPKLFVQYYCSGRGLYKSHFKSKEINVKKYLHVMRIILKAEYLLKYQKLPNTSMIKNFEELEKDIPADVYAKIKEFIELKKNGHGKDIIKEMPLLTNYFDESFERFANINMEKKIKEQKPMDNEYFNQLLRSLIIPNGK